jgi:hypothetical protein
MGVDVLLMEGNLVFAPAAMPEIGVHRAVLQFKVAWNNKVILPCPAMIAARCGAR